MIHRSTRWRLSAVVTSPDKPSGRRPIPKPSPVKIWALQQGTKIIEMNTAEDPACFSELQDLKPDLFVVISFGRILKKDLLELPTFGSVNVHGSVLPKYRGASPMQSAILGGETETGVSVMRMVEALDAGAVLLTKTTALAERETILTLEPRLSSLAAEALEESFPLLETKNALWKEQDPRKVTHCAKIKKEDGKIRWGLSAQELDRQVRAYLSWPGSYAFHRGKRFVVKKCRPENSSGPLKPGQIIGVSPRGIRVQMGDGCILLEELQLEGRNPLKASEFLKGYPLAAGELLE